MNGVGACGDEQQRLERPLPHERRSRNVIAWIRAPEVAPHLVQFLAAISRERFALFISRANRAFQVRQPATSSSAANRAAMRRTCSSNCLKVFQNLQSASSSKPI